MSRACIPLIIASLIMAMACDDDSQPAQDAGLDMVDATDTGTDTFHLPQGNEGHEDVSEVLKPGMVRAGRVTDPSQLLSGVKVEGQVGDFKLYNSRVAFIIRDERYSDGWAPYGGEVLDAMRLGQPGAQGHSLLGEIMFGSSVHLLNPTSVGVVNDGSDGQAALVRAIGEPGLMQVVAALLGGMSGLEPPVHLVIDYVLEPDSDLLEIRLRYFNKNPTEEEIPLTFVVLSAGDGASFFTAKSGFEARMVSITDYVAMVGQKIGYLLFDPSASVRALFEEHGNWILGGESVALPPFGEAQQTYLLGLSDGEPEAVLRLLRRINKQDEPATVSGRVLDPAGGPVQGARVHVQDDAEEPTYVTMTRSDDQGRFSVALEPGGYRLTAVDNGRVVQPATAIQVSDAPVTQDLVVGPTSRVTYSITDASDAPLPAKLTLIRTEALDPLPASFGERGLLNGKILLEFTASGSGVVSLPPGSYTVVASRGFEYEIDQTQVILTDDDQQSLQFTLSRSVDTTGHMCGDFHVHAMWSPDSHELYAFRATTLAAEGVEIPAITEHEYIGDLNPAIAALGLQKWVRAVSGEEVTTMAFGHFNPFPLDQDPDSPNRGAMLWLDKDPDTLFGDIRSAWPDAVLQVNHIRRGSSAYLDIIDYDPLLGTADRTELFSTNFDAIEVFNASGWTKERDQSVLDWFSFLQRGLLVTATGNSDCHSVDRKELGYPRNCVQLSTDEPAELSPVELARSIKEQRVLVSGGPFITVNVGGKGMGEVAAAPNGTAQAAITVQAPTWMSADTLQVIVGAQPVHTITLDDTTADPVNPVVRYDDTLEVQVDQDSWLVVVVTGSTAMTPVNRGDEPFALTNPVYLDVDGNGVYDPPLSF